MSVPIAHMLVAQTFSFAIEAGHPGVNRQTRQTLIDPLVEELGGPPLGVGEFLLAPFLRVTTALLKRNRLEVSSAVVPFVADIILYQARGGAIRDYIANAIPPAGDPIILLAHSLGGVACVDLLIERDLRDRVKALITAGSQAPLFYELNALQTLAFSRELPTHFPLGWLNFFDRNDFLAYIGSPVFGTKVRDFGIDSGTPFPNSHSAYWNCDSLWETVKSNLAPF